ncbi:MAG: hypothetical protein O2973_02090 [Gemmatimonadetes bacterium]|nr:hypothetical protein [Gemmatimonadota bacterium]
MDVGHGHMKDGGAATETTAAAVPRSRRVAIGCFTAVLGVMSGGMIAVLISKFVAFVTRAPSCAGIPTCNWHIYWLVGAAVGGISLSWLAVWTLGKPKRSDSA